MKKANPREIALKVLYKTIEKDGYSNILLNHSLSSGDFSPEDRAFITRIVYGVLENKIYLDWVIRRFSKIRLKKISPWIINILRISIYQILFMDRVPGFAAVNEGVKLAKKHGDRKTIGFVNGILRSVIRSPEKTEIPSENEDHLQFISLKYSYPRWMVEDWVRIYGQEFTEELCKSNNRPPEMVIRTNTLKTTTENLCNLLQKEGLRVRRGVYSPAALYLEEGVGTVGLNAFKEGLFYVQDESSMLCIEVLDPEPGQIMVDVCSAPGGKATYAAQMMDDRGRIIARDINENKLDMVKENCRRLGIQSVETGVFDAGQIDCSLIGRADRVVVDAPCSGMGIIRRKPDIKWKKEREHYTILANKQKKILENAARYLKTGGVLVYSTCTIMPDENEEVFKDFVGNNPDFIACDISPFVPESIRSESCKKGYLQLFPNIHGVDGFFIGKMMRIK